MCSAIMCLVVMPHLSFLQVCDRLSQYLLLGIRECVHHPEGETVPSNLHFNLYVMQGYIGESNLLCQWEKSQADLHKLSSYILQGQRAILIIEFCFLHNTIHRIILVSCLQECSRYAAYHHLLLELLELF